MMPLLELVQPGNLCPPVTMTEQTCQAAPSGVGLFFKMDLSSFFLRMPPAAGYHKTALTPKIQMPVC
ncbi:MAG: hypothetical protein OIN66_14125 [Candidatus Methanoperedens sp.]|nr:hypothetical protein [Candidatus Methanoperedens sp.]